MKIRLYDSMLNMLILIGVGVPLIFGGVLDTWRTALTIATILFTAIYLGTHRIKKHEENHFLYVYVFGVFVITIFEIIKAGKSFDYSVFEAFYALRQYMWLLLAIPMYYMIVKRKDVDQYLKKIVRIVMLSLGLRTCTWFLKNYLGITIFNNLLYEYGNYWGRSGKQRLDATALIGVLIPILMYFYRKNGNKKYLFSLGFVFCYLVFVSQTRTLIIGFAVCILTMIFFAKQTSVKKLIVQLSVLFIFALAINMGALDYLLSKMNISINDGSIGYRQYEYAYYSSLLYGGKWKTGLGIMTLLNSSSKKVMFGNLDTQMYLDDLGMFECFLQFGLFSVFLYGALLIYMIYVIVRCKKLKEYDFAFYLVGQFFYVAIVSIPLNLFGIQRSFSVPIIVAIVCAIHNLAIKKAEGKQV